MKIIALDQATRVTGYSVFSDENLIQYGEITSSDDDIYNRMQDMGDSVRDLVREFNPDVLSIEGVQYQNNQLVYSELSQLQGVIMRVAYELHVRCIIVQPSTWRHWNDIKGRKRKEQKDAARQAVTNLFHIHASEDASEAILHGRYTANTRKEAL